MVARIMSGKSIRGALTYNEQKVEKGKAELLFLSGFPLEAKLLSFKNKVDYFNKFTRQNTRAKTNTLHITLNFSPKDKLDNALLEQITRRYMDGIGFGRQPYAVYQHFDAAHPHLHIVTTNIQDGGRRIETHNLGRTKSEAIRKEIENDFGLIRAEDQSKEQSAEVKPIQLERVLYGKMETKKAISNVVREVLRSYKFCTLTELNAVLNQFGVYAFDGAPGSKMFKNGGLIYGLLDENNQKVGVAIKASSIFGRPTLKKLNEQFARNKIARKPFGKRLKILLDEILAKSRDQKEVEAGLCSHGIRIIFRKNRMGGLLGITFIDNATRVVFNGSDLGKKYAAKGFMEALEKKSVLRAHENNAPELAKKPLILDPESGIEKEKGGKIPALELPVIEVLLETLMGDEHESNEFTEQKKKRKKLQITQ